MKRQAKERRSDPGQTARLAELRAQVRELAGSFRVEEALELLQEIAEKQRPQLSNELVILKSRLSRVNRRERAGTLAREDAEIEKSRIIESLLELTDQIDSRPKTRSHLRGLRARSVSAEGKARALYLRILKEDVNNRLDASIHKARMKDIGIEEDADLHIELDIDDTPSATNLPWIYKDPDSKQEFRRINEAFTTYERRLLLLGAPGSGKTITLLHIAQQLIYEAENDAAAPIPLIVNLSKFQLKSPANSLFSFWAGKRPAEEKSDGRVERWLVSELTTGYPGISAEVAKSWVEGGRIAALMDGLDEVGDEYRAELVEVLNNTYLRNHPDTVVVLCSRINEYRPLQDRKETRLQLKGAITLQPLTKPQISEYLERARATGLNQALLTDETLYQMAQTPLTLSMMTLAYGGMTPSDIPAAVSLTERRHHLMEAYVAKMLQRKERRDRKIHYDENRDNDVPVQDYAYDPAQVNNYMGWLAVRLSVRMQTAFSPHRLFDFLSRELKKDWQSGVWWATVFSRMPIIFVVVALAGCVVAPRTVEAWRLVLYVALLSLPAYALIAWMFRSNENESDLHEPITTVLGITILSLIGLGALALSSIALTLALPFGIPPAPVGMMAACFGLFILMLLVGLEEGINTYKDVFLSGTIAVFMLSAIVMQILGGAKHLWYIPAVSLVAFQTIAGFIKFQRKSGWLSASIFPGVVAGLVIGQVFSIWLVGDLVWYKSLVLFVSVAALVLTTTQKPLLPLSGLLLSFILGGLIGGTTGSVIGPLVYGYLLGTFFYLLDIDGENAVLKPCLNFAESLAEKFEAVTDRFILSPVLRRVLAVTRCLPLRFRPFSRYAEQALLLKRSASDVEFMHRLLRDYFALRDLQPLLGAKDLNRRLEAIRSLGFQGEAAIDALADFLKDANPAVREAAAGACGKIASPAIVPHIEAALKDVNPQVRIAAVFSSKNLVFKDKERILPPIVNDPDLSVQRALLEVVLDSPDSYRLYYLMIDPIYRRGGDRMLANISNRDEIRNTIFQWVSTHPSNNLRHAAILLIERVRDTDGTPAVIDALLDRRFNRRDAAATALGRLGDPRAVKPLIEVLSHRNKSLRKAAIFALRLIGTPEALAAIKKFPPEDARPYI